MKAQTVSFARRYRAALLDYLLGTGEGALARAYDLGRTAIDARLGLLEVLRAHERALSAVLESRRDPRDCLATWKAAEAFLRETLAPFEMTYRGYVHLLERRRRAGRDEPSRAPDDQQDG